MPNESSTVVTNWSNGPLDYGDVAAEARALADGAALFELPDRARLTLRGRDRARFLHGFCTNDIKSLTPGQGCEAFVTSLKGKILEHLFVAADAEAILLSGTAGFEDALFQHLDRYLITDDVQIERSAGAHADLFLAGPEVAVRLAQVVTDATDIAALPPYGHRAVDLAGTRCALQRLDLLGGFGLLVTVPAARLGDVRTALITAGCHPAGATVFEAARIRVGLPLYGVDLTDDNLAQEAMRTERCISFKKGCYLGQEPIARIDALGHVNKQLTGVRLKTGDVPPRGAKVRDADGKDVGAITSAAVDPGSGQVVALGIVRAHAAKAGAAVTVDSPAGPIEGVVCAW